MKLYRTAAGIFVENDGRFFRLDVDNWDELLRLPELYQRAAEFCRGVEVAAVDAASILSPIGSQEVWAAGVTYYRSRNARME